ncbi:class I SAM-dependent methyltransferase [Mesobacillus maritimus]|uniref:class I SAM-dependent methyltransferase n=1 Tax=Mesobacillus maritimus TaxID=1643336 RepID=UPI0020407CC1|nr:class I SAM-dependent methyltransferase [Mesobacillus maritimus]MCM3588646.1 class I SAM-dependent methyltransferase [Mesobacillus maritimus]MCM3671831.1 class I SAM-dependent methyltransferase [Mesobacillus maritimus]
MLITTAGRTDEKMIARAQELAHKFNARYVPRNKKSVLMIMNEWKNDCIVVGKNRLELYPFGEQGNPFFFHPNSSMFRIKRLQKGECDPFIDAARLESGMKLLDCTLGLASDSIVASYIVGSTGSVIGVEGNPFLAYLVKEGLQRWDSEVDDINRAMRRIDVIHNHALNVLKQQPNNSFDCVYFDPMFEETIVESDGIKGLSKFALQESLSEELIKEALRVASKRIVLKDHFRSKRFYQFPFSIIRRKTSKFHFGVIEKT